MVDFARGLLQRLVTFEVLDRSLVVGAQAFSALVPLLIVLASVGGDDGRSFADDVIKRFDLHGDAADAVRGTFAAPADGSTLTLLSILFVVVSALSFTRAVQRTFERSWDLPRRGLRGTLSGVAWLGCFGCYWALFPIVGDALDGLAGLVSTLTGSFALWLITPYLLLGRRIRWQQLVPQAALTAVGMSILSAGLVVYAPRAMSASAADFGAIGIAFTLLSLLWAAGFVLVTAAVVGSYLTLLSWSPAQPGSVTPPSSSSSPAHGS